MKAVSSASGVISVSQQLAVLIILVLLERSLSPAKVLRRQICPSPFKLMTSQSVLQGIWIRTSCYGWFRGEWVTENIHYIRTSLFQVWQNRFLYFGVLIGNYRGLVGSLIINDVIMTSLLLLKISYVLANFLVLSDTLLFEYFLLQGKKLMEVGFCQKIQQMTS